MSETKNIIAKDSVFIPAKNFAAAKGIDLKKSINELSDMDKCYMLSIADFTLFCLVALRESRDAIKEIINGELLEDITNYIYNISKQDNIEDYSLNYIHNKLKSSPDQDTVDIPTMLKLMDTANKEFKAFIAKETDILADKVNNEVEYIAGKSCASKLLTALRLDMQGFMRGFTNELTENKQTETPDFLMFFNTATSFIICGASTPISTMRFVTDVMASFGERFNSDDKAENMSRMITSLVPPILAANGLGREDCKVQDMLSESFDGYEKIFKEQMNDTDKDVNTDNK